MKVLKVLPFLLAIFLLGTNMSFAQSEAINLTEEQKEKLAQNLEEYQNVLNLSEGQESEFEKITRKYLVEMKAVKDAGGGKLSMYRKVKAIQKSKNAEMEQLLSKGQYEVYLEKQEEMQKKMKESRK